MAHDGLQALVESRQGQGLAGVGAQGPDGCKGIVRPREGVHPGANTHAQRTQVSRYLTYIEPRCLVLLHTHTRVHTHMHLPPRTSSFSHLPAHTTQVSPWAWLYELTQATG